MVAFKHYVLVGTFQNEEVFSVQRIIVDVDSEGKVERQIYVLDKQYADKAMTTIYAWKEKNSSSV